MIHQGGRSGIRNKSLAFLRGARWIDLKEPTTLAGGGGGGGNVTGTIVELTSDQTIPGGGQLVIDWDQVQSGQDDGGFWSSGSPDVLTAIGDGWYFIYANVGFIPDSTGQQQAQVFIRLNTSTYLKLVSIFDIYTDNTFSPPYGYLNSPWINTAGFRYLSDGDEISVEIATSDATDVRASASSFGLLKLG